MLLLAVLHVCDDGRAFLVFLPKGSKFMSALPTMRNHVAPPDSGHIEPASAYGVEASMISIRIT